MNQFVLDVPNPAHVPFVRELLAQLRYVQIVEEPEFSEAEEEREDAWARAAVDRAKADPDQSSRPLEEVLRELDARPGYAPQPQAQPAG